MPSGHGNGVALRLVYERRTADVTSQYAAVLRSAEPDSARRITGTAQHPLYIVRLTVRADNRRTRLENTCLLGRNDRRCVAKHRHMVERNRRNNADLRIFDDICRITAAAQTGFENHNIAFLLNKTKECQCGRKLKLADGLTLGQCERFTRHRYPFAQARQIVVRDHHTVHADALVKLHQIRRGIQSGAQSGRLQRRGDHARGRALAVRARKMNKLQPVLRVSQRLAQRLDAVQTRLAGKSAERVYVFDCRFRIFGIHNSFFPCIIMIHLIITQFHQIENGELPFRKRSGTYFI